jgi:hypothetical protein
MERIEKGFTVGARRKVYPSNFRFSEGEPACNLAPSGMGWSESSQVSIAWCLFECLGMGGIASVSNA